MIKKETLEQLSVILISYVFIGAGAVNDKLLGINPSMVSLVVEWLAAGLLAIEVVHRWLRHPVKSLEFKTLIMLDIISLITVVPGLAIVTFARSLRMVLAMIRFGYCLDTIARHAKSIMPILWIYPVMLPVLAGLIYVAERGDIHSSIHNYFDAYTIAFQFAVSLGNTRPDTSLGMMWATVTFLLGLICIGLSTNALYARYANADGDQVPGGH